MVAAAGRRALGIVRLRRPQREGLVRTGGASEAALAIAAALATSAAAFAAFFFSLRLLFFSALRDEATDSVSVSVADAALSDMPCCVTSLSLSTPFPLAIYSLSLVLAPPP